LQDTQNRQGRNNSTAVLNEFNAAQSHFIDGWTSFQIFVAQCRTHASHPVLINFRRTVLQSGIIPTIKAVPETPFSAVSRVVGMFVGSSVQFVSFIFYVFK
jgi:hypothetical protein